MITIPSLGVSQETSSNELKFEVNRIYPYILITKDELNDAKTLSDLNRHFKSTWIRSYISVEVITIINGEKNNSFSTSETLSQEQIIKMKKSDVGSDISIKVKYIPENTMANNDPKKLDFTFSIDPKNEAKYSGDELSLTKYLKEKAIDKIPVNSFTGYDLTAIKFTIDKKGEIINVHVVGAEYQEDKKEAIVELLMETIRNMPCWIPASYINGTKVKQEFVLTVGNMKNCSINTLNIRRDGIPVNG